MYLKPELVQSESFYLCEHTCTMSHITAYLKGMIPQLVKGEMAMIFRCQADLRACEFFLYRYSSRKLSDYSFDEATTTTATTTNISNNMK